MADWQASVEPGEIFFVPGLGSCVGLAVYDAVAGVAGLAHIMLPDSGGDAAGRPAKFADTAVLHLVAELVTRGAARDRLVAKAAGGAQMFRSQGDFLAVGARNAEAVRQALESAGIPAIGTDLGGTWGRTIRFHMGTWVLEVRSPGRPGVEL
ncbi:MAG: chemotaxis protein CheD [Candidatus Sericytochromatia bacterium]|nr:chemotaxis protein CheD [Candidatus Tanganyikabacteria bacterium]